MGEWRWRRRGAVALPGPTGSSWLRIGFGAVVLAGFVPVLLNLVSARALGLRDTIPSHAASVFRLPAVLAGEALDSGASPTRARHASPQRGRRHRYD